MVPKRSNDKWICTNCNKEFDFLIDAENCEQDVIVDFSNPDNYLGYSKRIPYVYRGHIVEITSICTLDHCADFFLRDHDKHTGFCEWINKEEADKELRSMR